MIIMVVDINVKENSCLIDKFKGPSPEYLITVAFAVWKFMKLIHMKRKKTNYSIFV